MNVKKRVAAIGVAMVMLFGGAAISSQQAGAAAPNAGAWIVAPKWWGWCPGGAANPIRQVNVTNYTAGSMRFSGWSSADKVRISVVRGTTNQVQVSVYCQRTGWHGSGGYHYLSVDRDGRTFFVGIDGGTYRQ